MTKRKDKLNEALRIVHKIFPEAELVKRYCSRKKLSNLRELAAYVKSRQSAAFKSEKTSQQLSFDFGNNFTVKQRGGQ